MMLAALFGYGLEDEKEATAARDISFPEKSYDSFIDFLQVFENYNSVETFSPREEKFLVPVCWGFIGISHTLIEKCLKLLLT